MLYEKTAVFKELRAVITYLQNNLHGTYDENMDLLIWFIAVANKLSLISSSKFKDNVTGWREINNMLYNKFVRYGYYVGTVMPGGRTVYATKRDVCNGLVLSKLKQAISYVLTKEERGI